jgi:dCTP deaminase
LLNPNSYNYRLGSQLKICTGYSDNRPVFTDHIIPDEGIVLQKNKLYLANTFEEIGSTMYAMSLNGRSSLGRLGLFLQISANLGHTLSSHNWTLEIYPLNNIKVYAGMKIGQVSFWKNKGEIVGYNGTYNKYNEPREAFYDINRS